MFVLLLVIILVKNGDCDGTKSEYEHKLQKKNQIADEESEMSMINLLKSYDQILSQMNNEKVSEIGVKNDQEEANQERNNRLAINAYTLKQKKDGEDRKNADSKTLVIKINKDLRPRLKQSIKNILDDSKSYLIAADNALEGFSTKRSKMLESAEKSLGFDLSLVPPPYEWMTGKRGYKKMGKELTNNYDFLRTTQNEGNKGNNDEVRKLSSFDNADKGMGVKDFNGKPIRSWMKKRGKTMRSNYNRFLSLPAVSDTTWVDEKKKQINDGTSMNHVKSTRKEKRRDMTVDNFRKKMFYADSNGRAKKISNNGKNGKLFGNYGKISDEKSAKSFESDQEMSTMFNGQK